MGIRKDMSSCLDMVDEIIDRKYESVPSPPPPPPQQKKTKKKNKNMYFLKRICIYIFKTSNN